MIQRSQNRSVRIMNCLDSWQVPDVRQMQDEDTRGTRRTITICASALGMVDRGGTVQAGKYENQKTSTQLFK